MPYVFALRLPLTFAICLLLAIVVGCRSRSACDFKACADDDSYRALATQIEYPQVKQCSSTSDDWASIEPLTLATTTDPEYWDVELEQVVQMALSQSKILRDLGGAILQSPSSVQTYWNAALQETDPQFGIDAALSAFDAQFSSSIFGEKNDRAINNEFFGGGTRLLQQDALVLQSQLTKRAVTGSEFTLRHNVEYDANNAPSNLFPSAWNVNIESEFRHPLLQGGGMQFNRIAGPSRTPGLYGGVLIARVNTDIELADFEMSVRDLVSNIENAYWDLYFSYRDLDAKIAARDAALDTWRRIHALYEAGRRGGEAEKEAQAREQFFRFQEEVQNALSGRLIDGTRTGNGSGGGTFRGNGGVHVAERRLRRIMGLPPSDGRLLRPSAEPITAPVQFDWSQVTSETLVRRAELRRQRFQTRRRELEWIASKNHLLPRLDAIGRYRWRGFGDDLLDTNSNNPPFDNAYENLTGGNFQEWQLGVELTVPIGFRRAHSAARHAQMQLARARAILREQEHQVLHDVSGAVAEMQRAYVVSQTSFNRFDAAQQQLAAVKAAFEAEKAPLDLLLDAQRRLADAQSRYFRTLAEHAIAVKNVHFAKGTLLDYDGVFLSEGGWPVAARRDAARRESRRGKPRPLNYASSRASRVSRGAYDQHPTKTLPIEIEAPLVPEQAAAKPLDLPTAPDLKAKPAVSTWAPEVPSAPLPAAPTVDAAVQPASYRSTELILLPATDE
ncbi:MAG: TolC family protein [Planctomycetes bacterium]|nr:TolC family protein [Planctomycetota bacterium]